MRFAREIRLWRVKCLRAWGGVPVCRSSRVGFISFHIVKQYFTICEADYFTFAVRQIFHSKKDFSAACQARGNPFSNLSYSRISAVVSPGVNENIVFPLNGFSGVNTQDGKLSLFGESG